MKLPARKREDLLDKFVSVASTAVRQLDVPVSTVQMAFSPQYQQVHQSHMMGVQQQQVANYAPRPMPATGIQQQIRQPIPQQNILNYDPLMASTSQGTFMALLADPTQTPTPIPTPNPTPIPTPNPTHVATPRQIYLEEDALASFARSLPHIPTIPTATVTTDTITTSAASIVTTTCTDSTDTTDTLHIFQ